MSIPKIIHQTLPCKQTIDPAFQDNIANLKRLNPGWEYRLYDDDDIPSFVERHFGQESLDRFNLIDPSYGAARADFFRYHLMYVEGGVYLDIKSTATRPLDDVFQPEEEYILSHWSNGPDQEFAGWGRWPGLGPEGEYQQWHIICAPRHKFLEAVIEKINSNIDSCCAGESFTGHAAVVTATGPVAYTRAIQPILAHYKHRKVDIQDLGFRYTVLSIHGHHNKLSGLHYYRLGIPILRYGSEHINDSLISKLSKRLDNFGEHILNPAFMARSKGNSTKLVTFHGTEVLYLFQLDECAHDDKPQDCLYAPVRFELFGDSLSFFVEIAGSRVNLGLNAEGFLGSDFELDDQVQFPTFQIKPRKDGSFNIEKSGQFLSAEPGGKLVCGRTAPGHWESFHVA